MICLQCKSFTGNSVLRLLIPPPISAAAVAICGAIPKRGGRAGDAMGCGLPSLTGC